MFRARFRQSCPRLRRNILRNIIRYTFFGFSDAGLCVGIAASTLGPSRGPGVETQSSQGLQAEQEEQGREDEPYSLRPGLGYYSGSPLPAAGLPTHAEEEEGQVASSKNLPRHNTSPGRGPSSSDSTPRQKSGSRSVSPSRYACLLPDFLR